MPGIGETLREARMRRKIDMTDVEAATKIRAKYLRALENEEWDALPGTTFVKTFLRTYSEYLQLDSKRIVEEYRQRYERPSTSDLAPITPVGARRDRRPRRGSLLSPGVVLALGVVILLGALYLLGTWGDDDEPGGTAPNRVEQPRGEPTPTPEAERSEQSDEPRTPTRVRLQIVPTGAVWVCLVDASGRELVDGQVLAEGQNTERFRSRRFRVTFGNGNARMRLDGRSVEVPDRDEPVGYDLRPGRRPRELSEDARPTCA